MLPNSPQVKEVMLGADGVAAHMKAGATFIDCSSINPVASKEIAAALAGKGVKILDAPVSGGEPKAIDGTLSFMVGGDEETFNVCKPILSAMGASVVRAPSAPGDHLPACTVPRHRGRQSDPGQQLQTPWRRNRAG